MPISFLQLVAINEEIIMSAAELRLGQSGGFRFEPKDLSIHLRRMNRVNVRPVNNGLAVGFLTHSEPGGGLPQHIILRY